MSNPNEGTAIQMSLPRIAPRGDIENESNDGPVTWQNQTTS
jgi:hypothetical protein